MALTLSDTDLARLRAAQECLLSAVARPDLHDWCGAVVEACDRLFRSDRTLLMLPHFEGFEIRSSPGMAPFLDTIRGVIGGVEEGALRYTERPLDGSQTLRRRRGLEVWSNAMLEDLAGFPMEDTGWYYHEFIEPAGVAPGGGLSVQLPRGEVMLCVTPGHPSPNPFGDEWLELASLLLAPLRAAGHHLQRRQLRRRQLLRVIDRIDTPLWLVEATGADVHRNPRARELVQEEPEAARLVDAVAALAADLGRLRAPLRKSRSAPVAVPGERTLELGRGRYRLRGLYLEPHLLDARDLLLVEIVPPGPRLPSARALRERFELTRRQSEVALLLARGSSDVDIAAALGISPHTVRSHTEMVFLKLGIHTRKALALKLMHPGGPPVRPP